MEFTGEQFNLFSLVEEKFEKRSAWREFRDAIETHGPLMPQSYVKYVLDVSQQRVSELIQADRISRLLVRGKWFVPVASLEVFLADERKVGRPLKELTMRESFQKHVFKK
jgi:hypothetical protein